MSFFCLGLSTSVAFDQFFRWDGGVDAGIIEIRIMITPTAVILFRDLASFQFTRLLHMNVYIEKSRRGVRSPGLLLDVSDKVIRNSYTDHRFPA